MKVADTFPYFSAKTPILVTEGVGKVLFDGDRNEMPEELEEQTATRCEFLFNERKFWVSVIIPAQPGVNYAVLPDPVQVDDFGTIPFETTAEKKETPYAQNCGNCAFLNQKTFVCRVTREFKRNPPRTICCVYGRNDGTMDESDYEYQIVARRAFLDPSGIAGEVSNVTCADCAFFYKKKKKCFVGVQQGIDESNVCGVGKKRSDYE